MQDPHIPQLILSFISPLNILLRPSLHMKKQLIINDQLISYIVVALQAASLNYIYGKYIVFFNLYFYLGKNYIKHIILSIATCMVSCETKKTPAHQVHYINKIKHHIHILLLLEGIPSETNLLSNITQKYVCRLQVVQVRVKKN